MFSLSTTIFLFVVFFLVSVCMWAIIKNRQYGAHYVILSKSMREIPMATTVKAPELALVFNTLVDISVELKRPFFMRFWHYPKSLLLAQSALAAIYLSRLEQIEVLADGYDTTSKGD